MTTIQEIKKTMTDAFIANDTIKNKYGLSDDLTFEEQFSTVSLESILFYVIATIMWVQRSLFERHKTDVSNVLASQTPGTAAWYAYKAKLFQFGDELIPDTDDYDNSALTDEEVRDRQVIKFAAAVESKDKSILYLKVATIVNDEKQPLTQPQLTAFRYYLNAYSYAGVRVVVINDPADEMRLAIDIYYDAQVLNDMGARLDGTADTPLQDAIRTYLSSAAFNGMYSSQTLVDALQVIDGVVTVEIRSAASRYGVYMDFTPINAREIPHAGYYTISDEDLSLTFIPDEEIL